MARIKPLDRAEMPEFEHLFVAADEAGHFVPNFVRTLARRPEIYQAHRALRDAIVGPGLVSEEVKEMIAQVASLSAGCMYCSAHNANFTRRRGVAPERAADVWAYETSPHFTDAERAALRVAQAAAQVPNAVTDADFAELKEHYSDAAIVEIVAVIALFGFLNRFNDTMATTLEPAAVEAGETFLAPHGWQVGKHAATDGE